MTRLSEYVEKLILRSHQACNQDAERFVTLANGRCVYPLCSLAEGQTLQNICVIECSPGLAFGYLEVHIVIYVYPVFL